MTRWLPVVDVDVCPDCGEPYGAVHLFGCEEGRAILRACLADEKSERSTDEALERDSTYRPTRPLGMAGRRLP